MAVMLDGSSTQTRTGRWLRALTPQMVMRFVPVLGVVGVPLAFLVSYERQMAKAQYFGIPVEFIHVQLADAVAPFLTIAVLLWPLFMPCMRLRGWAWRGSPTTLVGGFGFGSCWLL
jgi:hypothetical protein